MAYRYQGITTTGNPYNKAQQNSYYVFIDENNVKKSIPVNQIGNSENSSFKTLITPKDLQTYSPNVASTTSSMVLPPIQAPQAPTREVAPVIMAPPTKTASPAPPVKAPDPAPQITNPKSNPSTSSSGGLAKTAVPGGTVIAALPGRDMPSGGKTADKGSSAGVGGANTNADPTQGSPGAGSTAAGTGQGSSSPTVNGKTLTGQQTPPSSGDPIKVIAPIKAPEMPTPVNPSMLIKMPESNVAAPIVTTAPSITRENYSAPVIVPQAPYTPPNVYLPPVTRTNEAVNLPPLQFNTQNTQNSQNSQYSGFSGITDATRKMLETANSSSSGTTSTPSTNSNVTMPTTAPEHTAFKTNYNPGAIGSGPSIRINAPQANKTYNAATPTGAPEYQNFQGTTDVMNALGSKTILPGTREWNALVGAQAGATGTDLQNQIAQNQQLSELSGQASNGATLTDRVPPVSNKSQYDLLRQQAQAQGAKEQQATMEELKQQLASRGLGAGTGFGEKELLKAQIAAKQATAGRLGQIDVQEAAAKEEAQQKELDRQLQRDIEQGRLSMEDKKMALDASQFKSKQEYDTWATQQGLTQQERDKAWTAAENAQQRTFESAKGDLDRQLTAQVEQGRITMQEKELANNAAQFRSKQDYDAWATQQGYTENERERAWNAAMQANTQAFQQSERISAQQFTTAMASMENDLTMGRMNLADQIDDTNKMQSQMMDGAYQKGLSFPTRRANQSEDDYKNEVLKAESGMTDLEKAAFRTGISGASYERYTALRDADVASRNAQITKLDPKDANFDKDLKAIIESYKGILLNNNV